MKARVPHQFYQYASQFTLKSMLEMISYCCVDIFNNSADDIGGFAGYRSYNVTINKQRVSGKPLLIQTWLIDLLYDLVEFNPNGTKIISLDETLHMISLYGDLANQKEKGLKRKNNILLYLYGFFGEQKRFQDFSTFFNDFAREKYILDIISSKKHSKNTFGFNVQQMFYEETGFKTDEYSALMLLVFDYCTSYPYFYEDKTNIEYMNPTFSEANFLKIVNANCITIEEIQKSGLKRQAFYTKPIIKINNEYIFSNPFLLLSAFVNSNFWIIRNRFMKLNNQIFTNAFGKYFEIYLEEIFENCLSDEEYINIPESKTGKRADWHLKICGFDILIEQKSAISLLSIKQNRPDIKAMEKYIIKTWGEAVTQLKETEDALKLNKPIKIILIYEDYYKSECLDELFKLNGTLINDGNYWLVTINELEMLLYTYKNNQDLFKKILEEKITSERSFSKSGRELIMFLKQNGVIENKYLTEFGISEYFDNILNFFTD